MSTVALAGEPKPAAPPHEPIGFVTGGVIGAFAAGPFGALVGGVAELDQHGAGPLAHCRGAIPVAERKLGCFL